MVRPNDFGDFTALLDSLADRQFWGALSIHFQNGALIRCVLEESAKHPRQLLRDGKTAEAHDDDTTKR